MNVRRTQCRTCLKIPANKDIYQLEEVLNAYNKNCSEIMMFCLDITVTPNSNITTNLCYHCYRKIVAFYKFKALSIKNDDYWKSVDVDENGIKLENSFNPDEFGPIILEDSLYVAEQLDVKYEDIEDRDDNELQSLEIENKFGEIKDEPQETVNQQNNDHLYAAPVPKKRKRSKKLKLVIGRNRFETCEQCGKSVRNLRKHLTAHRLKGELKMMQCKFCPKVFASNEGLKKHHRIKHLVLENKFGEIKDEPKETGYQQNIDHPYAAPVPKKRMRSKKLKISIGRRTCEECGKSVHSLKSHLTAHRLKGELKMIQCKFCPKLFATNEGLKRHLNFKHLGLKKECDICHKQYVNLLAHKLRVHAPHAPRFACVFCQRQFVSQFALHVHLATHKRPHYECDVCHRKFATRYQITCHIQRVHEKIKRYQCHVCPKGFYLKNQIEDHLRTHSTERPYICDDCGKCYGTKACLGAHRRYIHGAPRTVQCQLCDKSYANKSSLKKHVISHTKEKNYSCQFCDARFSQSHHLNRHVSRHHKVLVKPSDWRVSDVGRSGSVLGP